jgi:homoserine O-acetyltransferase
MLRAGKHATYTELQMDLGHDSFLVDAPDLYDLLKHFLSS